MKINNIKNNYRYLISIILISFLLVACSKDEAKNQNGNNEYTSKNNSKTINTVEHGALIEAAKKGQYYKVEDLIKNGANINEYIGTEQNQITPLITAIIYHHSEIALLLMQEGADVTQKFEGYSAKDYAFYEGLYEIVDLIINKSQ